MNVARLSIKKNRALLEEYISCNPVFFHSLNPVEAKNGPRIVKEMSEAAKVADVGPMAAVAGVLADLAVEDMIRAGARVAVVENGGEASAASNIPIDIMLAAGNNVLSKRFGFRLENFPVGVATSSGKFSHAVSFGDADAVTIFAENAGLADAASTAAANIVIGDDEDVAVSQGIEKAMSIKGVKGALIVYGGMVGRGGKLPKLIKVTEVKRGQ